MEEKLSFILKVTGIDKVCAAGEEYGRKSQKEGKIPVFSCEGGCIKGEIARQAANLVAKNDGYARACHGEFFTVPGADLSKWVREAKRVVVIDGCFLHCHGRIAENFLDKEQLVVFDALSIHKRYANLMNVDDVPESERMLAAGEVAEKVMANLKEGAPYCSDQTQSYDCGSSPVVENTCS